MNHPVAPTTYTQRSESSPAISAPIGHQERSHRQHPDEGERLHLGPFAAARPAQPDRERRRREQEAERGQWLDDVSRNLENAPRRGRRGQRVLDRPQRAGLEHPRVQAGGQDRQRQPGQRQPERGPPSTVEQAAGREHQRQHHPGQHDPDQPGPAREPRDGDLAGAVPVEIGVETPLNGEGHRGAEQQPADGVGRLPPGHQGADHRVTGGQDHRQLERIGRTPQHQPQGRQGDRGEERDAGPGQRARHPPAHDEPRSHSDARVGVIGSRTSRDHARDPERHMVIPVRPSLRRQTFYARLTGQRAEIVTIRPTTGGGGRG